MKRKVESSLKAWLDREERKPLVLMGARQVGKTWLMKDFGRRHFARCHVFNFDKEKDLATLFRDTKRPDELLPKLSALSGFKIDIAKDLVVFDEIQDCPEALNSLKYFYEDYPRLAIMAAGSLLGVRLRKKGAIRPPRRHAYHIRSARSNCWMWNPSTSRSFSRHLTSPSIRITK